MYPYVYDIIYFMDTNNERSREHESNKHKEFQNPKTSRLQSSEMLWLYSQIYLDGNS